VRSWRPFLAAAMSESPASAAVTVRSLSGKVMAEVTPIPATVLELKVEVQLQCGTPCALQQLLDGDCNLLDNHILTQDKDLELLLCVDQTPMFSWDIAGNPAADHISADGGHLYASNLRTDFVNVVAKEPVHDGIHFFEFVVHKVQDEQWCGVVGNTSQAGCSVYGTKLAGRFYYFNRGQGCGAWLRESQGSNRQTFAWPKDGDVIGMLLDVKSRALVFALNGELQGSCTVPGEGPLYFFTTVDRPNDHMELRKPLVGDAPAAMMAALQASEGLTL